MDGNDGGRGGGEGMGIGRTYDAAFCVFVVGVPAYAHDHRPDVSLHPSLCIPVGFPLPVRFPFVNVAAWFPLLIDINTSPSVIYSAFYVLIPAYA